MRITFPLPLLFLLISLVSAIRYHPEYAAHNLNTNETAVDPLHYWGEWENHTYHPSPPNWRLPTYTLFLDRFVDGSPHNNDINATAWETDPLSNQLRFGGDIAGLLQTLDYLVSMRIRTLYIAGSAFINAPWGSDSYSPLDLTLLDAHFGTVQEWQELVEECHKRGMYVILDNTMATMGDLIGFEGWLNESTPFAWREHTAVWKGDRRYHDFRIGDSWDPDCEYPRFYDADGTRVGANVTEKFSGCRDSEFDQYGDIAAFGEYPEYQRQLSKFAFVQDRLREWRPSVLEKIIHFSCMTIAQLDIDGFRIDKALQVTVDAQGAFSQGVRDCAKRFGKENFFIPGEVVSGNAFGAVYYGRGKEPSMSVETVEEVLRGNQSEVIREPGLHALDGGAFHYSVYRGLTRFLGMDGVYGAEFDTPVNWVQAWNAILKTNDLSNANTDLFDPRHMYGVTNHDVFRWPSMRNGTAKQLLGHFITTLLLPGIPLSAWGEEQEMYVFDNTATNYIFGRQPMSSSLAWQMHGCYQLGAPKYHDFPMEKGLYGCFDDKVSLDQRDPSHPVRGVMKAMYELRELYPVLQDGWWLQPLSNQTYNVYLPGSEGTETETGLWSVLRSRYAESQDLVGAGGNQSVWLVYQNDNEEIEYRFNCSDMEEGLVAPFDAGSKVRNLFWPYDEYTLEKGAQKLGFEGSNEFNGCLSKLTLPAWGFKAFVPSETYRPLTPLVTKFHPGHDARIFSQAPPGVLETVDIELHFSDSMSCDSVTSSLKLTSDVENGSLASVDAGSISCSDVDAAPTKHVGERPTTWVYRARLRDVAHGVHRVTISNVTTSDGKASTQATDHFLFRVGYDNNPMVFPGRANYSSSLLHTDVDNGGLYITHSAAGAEMFRYSLDFGGSYSNWTSYTGGNTTLTRPEWKGTDRQRWDGEHVTVQYWSALAGSSTHFQHGDLAAAPRRFPHLFLHGPFNQYGFDGGLRNDMHQRDTDGVWEFDFNAEWPAFFHINVWGMNPDGLPDKTAVYGDVNADFMLDRIAPMSLLQNVINITDVPPAPYVAYRFEVDDAKHKYALVPVGSRSWQIVVFVLCALVPLLTGCLGVWAFMKSFYQVKFNEVGVGAERELLPGWLKERTSAWFAGLLFAVRRKSTPPAADNAAPSALAMDGGAPNRRKVLIATMEYDIEDWAIKVKIGGLGVMAQLMGKNLGHLDLIWVVPCVGGVNYPRDTPAAPMVVTILDKPYEVNVQYHTLRNITYVLLDAPIFREQTQAIPYPPRMDDLSSAIYYSAWNSCIAEAIKRFNVDFYHINDYHGALAPLHLLPQTIPCCLSLHNAEFQGLWPIRSPAEFNEVARVFNLKPEVVREYVQFGDVFNLLHAGVSYLRNHQKGFGAVGVSKKYGVRAYARYPIFWGLEGVGSLPNPDPTDTADWHRGELPKIEDVAVDTDFEGQRAELKRQTQEWAGLEQNPDADLLVFVGRWSEQKGVDLIADVFPSIIEENSNVQLICVGPVIDLYGRFAALKLDRMMKLYPGRVFSKPEFTFIPPFVFSGAEFALIPSRDEPFGLVAVEFGRKGALGIGARVGGLGQMPGWWFTIESTTTKHLIAQFKTAIKDALESKKEVRAMMRARSSLQRFPVAQWVEDLETLQSTSVKRHDKYSAKSYQLWKERKPEAIEGDRSLGTEAVNSLPLPPRPAFLSAPPSRQGGGGHGRTFSDNSGIGSPITTASPTPLTTAFPSPTDTPIPSRRVSPRLDAQSDLEITEVDGDIQLPAPATLGLRYENRNSNASVLSLVSIVGEKKDFGLQKVIPTFTDANGKYAKVFTQKLEQLSGRSSEGQLCIEENLLKYQKKWLAKFYDAKLGRPSTPPSTTPSIFRVKRNSVPPSVAGTDSVERPSENEKVSDEFLLGEEYAPPTGIRRIVVLKIGDWPIYSILLALGQIIAANSYQITLLTGEVGQSPEKLYIVATIYLFASLLWWYIYRKFQAVYCLSLPFLFYGMAFFLIGMAPFVATMDGRGWVQKVATGCYATASASGSMFFALNFGDEGGVPVQAWVYRACIIQGTQQLYVVALWYWGSVLTKLTDAGITAPIPVLHTWRLTAITTPLALLLWFIAFILFIGLPKYYRRAPGAVPSFYASLLGRKIITWFFFAVMLQNYFLSAPYGRNWRYLWSSAHAEAWQIVLLVAFFFILVWAGSLRIFSSLSKSHSWILPVFAISLGAPRWAQMLWGTSNVGLYLPWAWSPLVSTLLGRALWLWLGVLDAVQGVGLGMVLLQTLTRLHITATLIAAQVLGSVATIAARGTAGNKDGPGDVFPDFSLGGDGLRKGWFWAALLAQLIVCIGFMKFFRKEQLGKA